MILRRKKVKWKTATTGKFWWKRKRYVTSLSARDFERFKFFIVSPKPCGAYHKYFAQNKSIPPIDICYWKGTMVMANIQFRNAIFNHKKMKIRIPKEYIYTQRKYLAGGVLELYIHLFNTSIISSILKSIPCGGKVTTLLLIGITLFYIGPELKTNLNNSDYRYFEANLNIGYTLEYVHSKFAGRLFDQVGYGSDFIKYKEKSIYPVGQIGLTFFLW